MEIFRSSFLVKDKVHNRYGTVLRRDDAAVLCSLDFAEKGELKDM